MQKEIFKDIPTYEGIYQISNLGNVKSLGNDKARKEKILKVRIRCDGYYQVNLWKVWKQKTIALHVLVAMAFLGHIPDGTHKIVTDHKNDIKTDNRVENLQLLTNRDNISKYYLTQKTSSKYRGVSWHKQSNKWVAQIKIDGKVKHLGLFDCQIKASETYQKALKEILCN
jgi:hypothetical protein